MCYTAGKVALRSPVLLLLVYVLFPSVHAQNGSVKSFQKISDTAGSFTGTLINGDRFGYSVSSLGDLDGDGVTDLVVGAFQDDDGGTNRGAVWILFLNSDGTVKSDQKISDTQGSFTGTLDDSDEFGTEAVSLGDLDGDGVIDIAVTAPKDDDGGTDRGAVWILFLNASGTVKSHQKISDTSGSFTGSLDDSDQFATSIAKIGDLDGDGVVDLAAGTNLDDDGGTNRGAVWILFLNSNGTVKSHQKISDTAGSFTGTLDDSDAFGGSVSAFDDLDGDGVEDLAVGAQGDDDGAASNGAVWILFLNTNGTIKSHQKISSTQGDFGGSLDSADSFGESLVSLGDLDGDGVEDLAVGAPSDDDGGTDRGAVYVLLLGTDGTVDGFQKISDLEGNFSATLDDSDRFGGSGLGSLGDLDGDGVRDLAVSAYQDDDGGTDRGAVYVLFLRKRPTITSISPTSGKPGDSVTITGTNFNTTPANNTVFFGAVKASVTAATTTQLTTTVPTGATLDAVTVSVGGQTAMSTTFFKPTFAATVTGIDNASFSSQTTFTTLDEPLDATAADFDGDGKVDFVVGHDNTNKVSIYRNTSTTGTIDGSSFATKVDLTADTRAGAVAVIDLDADGDPDLVVGNAGANSISVFRNTSTSGSLSFDSPVTLTTGTLPVAPAVGDIDGDGKPDVICAAFTSTNLGVFRNISDSGGLAFAARVDFAAGAQAGDAAVGDIDGDGKLDVVLRNTSDNDISVFRNTSTPGTIDSGTFAAKVDFATHTQPVDVQLGDMDGDGKLDIVVSDVSATQVSIFRNLSASGSISLDTRVDISTPTNNKRFSLADVDGDGKLDVAVPGYNGGTGTTVEVLRNTSSVGSVSLASAVSFSAGTRPEDVTLADIDGDGKSEMMVTNFTDDTFSIYRNLTFSGSLPTISSISPTSGKPGDSITITGTNFDTTPANNVVFFGGAEATVTAATATQLTVTVPEGASHDPIHVLASGRAARSPVPFSPTYAGVAKTITAEIYASPTVLSPGTTTRGVVTGDFDEDGFIDIAVTNQGTPSVAVYRSTGKSGGVNASSFATKVDLTADSAVDQLATGDVDGDGHLDLVAANSSSNTVSVFLNTFGGGISFASKVDFATGSSAFDVALADIDGDGKLDIIVPNRTDNTVSVLRNTSIDGTASFAAKVDYAADANTRHIAVSDFDGDGKIDIASINEINASVSVFRNTATAGTIDASSLAAHVKFTVAGGPLGLAVGDFDGDGKPDLASTGTSAMLSILRNTGSSGTLSFATKVDFSNPSSPSQVAAGDIDGDGKIEIVTSHQTGANDTLSVFKNNSTSGSISFATRVEIITPATSPFGVHLADIDGDDRPELIAANQSSGTVSVFNNIADLPTLSAISPTSAKPGASLTITGTNFNTTPANNTVFFDPIKATVTAATATQLTVTVPDGAGYGPLHVITASRFAISDKSFLPTYAGVAKSISTSTLASRVTFATGTTAFDAKIGDLDGDGKPDLVVTNNGDDDLSVYRNTSTEGGINGGSFAAKADFATGTDPIGVAIHDLDGDGKPELIVANNGATSVSVLRNTSTSGSISFAGKVDFTANANPTYVAVDDFDGDGKPDLAVSSQGSSVISVHRNTTVQGTIDANSFATKVTFATGSAPQGVAAGDIDGDGKPELLSANVSGNSISIFRNTATAGTITSSSFATKVDYTAGTGAKKVGLVDGDGDGKLDVVVANNSASSISVFINQATSGTIDANSLATKIDITAGSSPTGIDFGDFDGDGLVDIAIANDAGTLSLFENLTSGSSVSIGSKVDFSLGVTARDIAVADLDGDNRPEVVIPNLNSGTVSVFHNIADPPKVTSLSSNNRPPGASLTITGTGFDATTSNNTVYFDPIKGTVTSATATQVVTTVPDGAGYGPVGVLVNKRIGMSDAFFLPAFAGFSQTIDSTFFSAKTDFTAGNNALLTASGDLDGDGKVDLAVSNNSGTSFSVLRNTGSSGSVSFATKVDFTTGSNPWGIAIGDLDGDGKLDVVTTASGGNVVSVFRNTGSSGSVSFATKVDFTTGAVPLGTAIEDLDGDGKLDIAVVNQTDDDLSVFRNTSVPGTIDANSFAAKVDFATGDQPDRVAIGDVDGDGKPELLVTNAVDQTVSVLRNTSTPGTISSSSFASKVDFSSGVSGIVLGDVDGDDKLDLVAANGGLNTVSVLRNTSTSGTIDSNSFATKVDLSVGSNAYTVKLADVDGDRKPDIVVINRNDDTVSLIKNNATSGSITTSSFETAFTLDTGDLPSGLEVVDVDGDDKPDVTVVNTTPNTVSVFRNLAKLAIQNVTVDSAMADPQGVAVRVIEPDSGVTAAIGDTVRVQVIALPGVSKLDTVIVGLSTNAEVLNFGNLAFDTLFTATSTSASADTFAATFGIAAGDTQVAATAIAVARVHVKDDTTGLKQLDNQSTFEAVSGLPEFGTVGDQVRFGIDGRRPVNAAFDSVLIDTSALTNAGGSIFGTRTTSQSVAQSVKSVKVGDGVTVKVAVDLDSLDITGIDSVKVFVVDAVTSGYQVPDSSFYAMSWKATAFLGNGGIRTGTFTATEGLFSSNAVKDNMRIKPMVFFTDKAGNLSAATDTATAAAAFDIDVQVVADTRAPELTAIRPKASGDRFTGRSDTTMTFLRNDGTTVTNAIDLSPLSLSADEGTMSVLALVGSDTAAYAGGNANDTLNLATVDSFSAVTGKVAGDTVNLKLVVKDSVGNPDSLSIADVILDQKMPVPKNLFPASSKLDTAVITNLTRHPRFEALEDLDSVTVRFVQVTSGTRDTVRQSLVDGAKAGVVVVTVADSLVDDATYAFQAETMDLARNVFVTAIDTFAFDAQFANPMADSFLVTLDTATTSVDSVIAGVNLPLKLTAIDTALTNAEGKPRAAVTFNSDSVVVRAVGDSVDATRIRFAGTGVTDNGDGSATLDGDGWVIGSRVVKVTSEKALDDFGVVVEAADGTGGVDSLTVDAAEFRTFNVSIVPDEARGNSATGVGDVFEVFVEPADGFGNPSLKVFDGQTNIANADSLVSSTNLLDSRVPGGNLLAEVWFVFSSNHGEVRPPQGSHRVGIDGGTFTFGRPTGVGEGLIIHARSANAPGDTLGVTSPRTVAAGSVGPIAFAVGGPAFISPDPPDTLIVADYRGADGSGDQGGFVVATFPKGDPGFTFRDADFRVRGYRIYREVRVSTTLNENGEVDSLDAPVERFIPWAVVDRPPTIDGDTDSLIVAVVPAIDNVETRWAVASEWGGTTAEDPVNAKPAADDRAVREMMKRLGYVDLVPAAMTEAMRTAYGGRFGDLPVARLDPMPAFAFAGTRLTSSRMTISEPARAVDDIPPAPATGLTVTPDDDGFTVTWTLSVDDRVVAFVPYRGYAVPIPGVRTYEVLVGASEDALVVDHTVAAGVATASVVSTGGPLFRVDVFDGTHRIPSVVATVSGGGRPTWRDADGQPVYIVAEEGDTPFVCDFDDFLAFAASFNTGTGSPLFNPRADTDDNGQVEFADFLNFAASFGRVAVTVNGLPAALSIRSRAGERASR